MANELSNIVDINYLSKENSTFELKNGFLTFRANLKNEEGNIEEKYFDRVFLHRAFPFDDPFEYISVLDKDIKEIGLIRNINNFDEETQHLIENELNRKYYSPKITAIHSIKERYGFSYWKVKTVSDDISFTLQDTYRCILKVNAHRIFILDVDGNRYEIEDVEKLDNVSYKKIELYL